MSDEESKRPDRPSSNLPPQPYQIIGEDHTFTPYFLNEEGAKAYPGPSTPDLVSNLYHPPQEFPVPRNQFPASDPIMDARGESGTRPGELTYEQVQALKNVKDMSDNERRERDTKEFPSTPPDALSKSQGERWKVLLDELLRAEKTEEDPYKLRARGELRKLQKLADLAGGTSGEGSSA